MELKSIKQVLGGTFINRYDIQYETADQKEKTYEIVSRNANITNHEELAAWHSKTICIIGLSRNRNRILLNKQYQMAVGDWVYNFPSGHIEEGETPTEAARRTLLAKTGLHFIKRIVRLRSSYNAIGLTDESTSCVIAIIDGEIQESHEDFEEIEAQWLTKNEVKELLKTSKMSARAQLFCFLWAYGDLSLQKINEEQADFKQGNLR